MNKVTFQEFNLASCAGHISEVDLKATNGLKQRVDEERKTMSGCEAVVLGLIKHGRHVGVSGFSVAPCQLRGLVKLLKPLN